jgi:hypothetical protein
MHYSNASAHTFQQVQCKRANTASSHVVSIGICVCVYLLQVVLFFLEKQGELAQRLSAIRQKVPNFGPEITDISSIAATGGLQTINSSVSLAEEGSNFNEKDYETELNSNINALPTAHGLPYLTHNELDELSRQYTAVGQDLVKLLRFLQLNVTGLRKVS